MPTSKQRRFLSVFFLVVLFPIVLSYMFSVSSSSPDAAPSEIKLQLEVYDYYTREPIEGLPINLGIYTGLVQEGYNRFRQIVSEVSVSANSTSGGQTIIDLPSNFTLSRQVSLQYISMPGVWVLERAVGERELSIVNGRWWISSPQMISSNQSAYAFRSNVNLLQNYEGPSLILGLKLYLARGQVIQIFDPTYEVNRLAPYLRISTFFSNFIEFGENSAIVPVGEPLIKDMSLSFRVYGSYEGFPLSNLHISLDIEDEVPVDLTPVFIRSLSPIQTRSLRGMLDTLEPYGFELSDLYTKLNQISTLYEQSARDFENQDPDNEMKNLVSALYLYRDTYYAISSTYSGAFGWTPTLIVVLIFFSLAFSRLVTEKSSPANVIFIVFFSLIFLLFIQTQPNLNFYVNFVLSFLTQKSDLPFFSILLAQGLQIILVAAIMFALLFTRLKDYAFQTFGVSIKNLRRRRLKTMLALSTILIVSASSMLLLTFTSETPVFRFPILSLTSKVDNSLVIYKRVSKWTGMSYSVWNEPIEPFEIKYLSGDWVDSMNIYGINTVRFSRVDGFTISNFNRFNMILINPQFMEECLNASKILGSGWSLNSTDRDMILVGSKLASQYNLTSGSEVLLNDRRFTVKSVFDEQNAIENLKDSDGDFFFRLPSSPSKIFDPETKEVKGGSFIVGSINDFSIYESEIWKVSIKMKNEYANNMTGIAERFLPLGLDCWTEGDARVIRTYEIHVSSKGSVLMMSSGESTVTLFGNWQTHLIPIAITTLLLFANALGTISERRSEIRTIFTLGASPTRIRFIFMLEGMTLGIIGGILGYVFGYGIAQTTRLALPSLVLENMMSSTPFTVAFFTALLSSIVGCLLPSKVSVKSAIPSGTLAKKIEDILKIRGNEAVLEVPIRLQLEEIRLFNDFLKNMIKTYSYAMFRQIVMRELAFTESQEEKEWRFIVTCASDFEASILAKLDQDIRVHIRPYKASRWGGRDFQNLRIMAPTLRKDLMSFLDFKRDKLLAQRL